MIRNIDITLSSPESALLLSDLYDHVNKLKGNNVQDQLIGPVLYRNEEDVVSCTRTDDLIKSYHNFRIKEFFGISLIEFMDMSGWQINLLTENAISIMEDKQKELEDVQNEIKNNEESTTNNIYKGIGELENI